jgi:hypothetical protein
VPAAGEGPGSAQQVMGHGRDDEPGGIRGENIREVGEGAVVPVGEDLLDDRVAAVLGLGLHELERGVGEDRVVTPDGEQLTLPGGGQQVAADLARHALRLSYAGPQPQPRDTANIHHNLANFSAKQGTDRAGQRAHRLAAALIRRLSDMSHDLADTMRALEAEMHAAGGTDPSLPSTVTQVIEVAERTEGVRLRALLTTIQPDQEILEDVLAEILPAG